MNEGTSGGALPEPSRATRASDDDRQDVVDRLRDAAGKGLLDLHELEERLSAAYAARTLPELTPITADLPAEARSADAPDVPAARAPGWFAGLLDDDGFRAHLVVYALVIGMLVGIWALTSPGGHFWPFYPAAGWGIGLGSHANAAASAARRRRRGEAVGPTPMPDLPKAFTVPVPGALAERVGRHAPARDADGDADHDTAGDTDTRTPEATGNRTPEASKQYVVAMFVDVVQSTQLTEALGDEAWARVRRSFTAVVDDCVGAAGGWQVNTIGDGVLVRFEEPASAATAARAILARLDRQRVDTGFAPSVRIGIHSGEAMDDDGDIIGAVVNLAARVTAAAGPDEVLLTEHVADHLGPGFDTEGRGLHDLKGVSRPRHLLALRPHGA